MKRSNQASKNRDVQKPRSSAKKSPGNRQSILKRFSSIEGTVHAASELQQLAGTASAKAAAKAALIGLPKVYATDKEVVQVSANGQKVVLDRPNEQISASGFFVKYKKGTVLHASRK